MDPSFALLASLSGVQPLEVISTYVAGTALLVVGLLAARSDAKQARGLDKIVVLSNLFFALPLAVFGAEHLAADKFIVEAVPPYMPWRLFWVYFVGVALMAAALSIASRILVRWSGLFFGIMLFSFVAMLSIPAVLESPREQISWVLTLRDMSFAGGGWVLAGHAMDSSRAHRGKVLVTVGRILIGIAAVFFGVEQFLRPLACPGVPLEKLMPVWIPGRALIGYVTAVILFTAGASILLAKKTRRAATYLGTWMLLLVATVYAAILVASMSDPSLDVQLEAVNYFADTLLFAGTVLALAMASAQAESSSVESPG